VQIYKITNTVNGKIYIGKDESDDALYFGSGILIKKAIKKYGLHNFTKEIIEHNIQDKKLLEKREIFWIEKYNSTDKKIGYNICKGGNGGDTMTNNPNKDIIIEKIKNTSKGRVFTEQHIKKLKENHNSKDPKVTKKIADKLRGKEKSTIHKEKISKSISEYYKKNGGNLRFKGDNNPMKKCKYLWYTNESTGKSLRLKETDIIPDGFTKGRLNFKGDNNPMRK
jgi:hypothetical protein